MHLTSITVRNYRVHREQRVDFDRQRTLIGGPNESGKSTLIEAAHRALFLKAKGNTEMHRSMLSRAGGHPEVELMFESKGRAYRLVKRFSGATGTTSLTEIGGSAWAGDEAEEKLAALLGVEVGGSGGSRTAALQQWAHLWIWQGKSGTDPTEHANTQRDSLLGRLQDQGGAVTMQSDLDATVAGAIAARITEIFGKSDKPRVASDLGRAMEAEQQVKAELATAEAALERLVQAAANFSEAERRIQEADIALADIAPKQAEVEAKLAHVATLRNAEAVQAAAAKSTAEKHESLKLADEHVIKLGREIDALTSDLAPLETVTTRLMEEEEAAHQSETAAEAEWRQAGGTVRAVRLRHDLAQAHLGNIEKADRLEQLRAKLAQVRDAREIRTRLEEQLAQTPNITAEKLQQLRTLEGEGARTAAALEAIAAGIEVITSDAPVRVGDHPLGPGETYVLTDDAEITIGPSICLRIRPGGGTSLSAARQKVHQAKVKLQELLDACGLSTVAAAVEAQARRQQLETEIKTANARLDGLGAATIEKEFGVATSAAAAAQAEVDRRLVQVPGMTLPADTVDAESLLKQEHAQLREAESSESRASILREGATRRLRESAQKLTAHRERLHEKTARLADVKARLNLLIETHGTDAARSTTLAQLQAARAADETVLAATRESLKQLQPHLLESDRERYRRAFVQHSTTKGEAENVRAAAHALLQRDGSTDPHADLAVARAQVTAATGHRQRLERQAGALRLLNELFLEEQRALAEQFTAPLAARITAYLECLFGPGARAIIELEDNKFSQLRLVRSTVEQSAFDFATLSGGTREQLAAAMCLAMAEVLAETHDGCLPVIFDDAFAHSDPARVQVLQRMLDHGASRGLQIIILSCNPADYTDLGARHVPLR